MSQASYLPVSDADRVIWLNNFKVKIAVYAATLGFTAAEITAIVNDAAFYQYVVGQLELYRQTMQALSAYKNQLRSSALQMALSAMPSVSVPATVPVAVPSGIFNRIVTIGLRIRRHPNYTTAIGQDLGIIAPVVPFNPAAMQPELTVGLDAGRPKLKWKKGDADGVQIYVDRGDGNGFVPLDKSFRNVYIDGAEVPANQFGATWSYKLRYLIGDDEVGVESLVVSVNVIRI